MAWSWKSPADRFALIQMLVVLGPLASLVMNGPSYSATMFLGGSAALAFLFRSRPNLRLNWRYIWVLAAGLGVYALLAFLQWDHVDTYRGHYALLSLYYGVPAGVLFRQLVRERQGEALVLGFALMSIGLAVAGYTAVQTAGLDNIVSYAGSGVSRTNIAGDEVFYWRFFSISNVIVGVIPYTIFALCAMALLFIPRLWRVKFLFVVAIALAIYVNFLVVTRTTILAGVAATGALLLLQFKSRIREIRPKAWMLVGIAAVLPVAVVVTYARYTIELGSMLDRFALAFQDGRLLIWSESIPLILRYPLGGGIEHLMSANWGHNLFLDAGLSTGIVGLLAILAVVLIIARRCWQVARAGRLVTNIADIYMVAAFIGTLLVNMVMPPQVSMMCMTLMFAGYIAEVPELPARNGSHPRHRADRGAPFRDRRAQSLSQSQ